MKSDVPSWWPKFIKVRVLAKRAGAEAALLAAEAERVRALCEEGARVAATRFSKDRLTSYRHDIPHQLKGVQRLATLESLRRRGAHDFEKVCRDCRHTLGRAREVMARDGTQRQLRDRFQEECLAVREKAAPVLVGIAKTDFERCRADFNRAIRSLPASKQLSEATSALKEAQACLEKMDRVLQREQRAQYALAAVKDRVNALDRALLATDAEEDERYRIIVGEVASAEQSIGRGDLNRGEALIEKAQVDLGLTHEFLDRAARYGIEELELWRTFARQHPGAAAPYAADLAALSANLAGDDLRRWQELKGKIERVVQAGARQTRAVNADAISHQPGLQLEWEETKPERHMEFARAVGTFVKREGGSPPPSAS